MVIRRRIWFATSGKRWRMRQAELNDCGGLHPERGRGRKRDALYPPLGTMEPFLEATDRPVVRL